MNLTGCRCRRWRTGRLDGQGNVQNAVGVELNAGLHRSAQSWVSKIKQLDFVLGSYLQSATFIEADMFHQLDV